MNKQALAPNLPPLSPSIVTPRLSKGLSELHSESQGPGVQATKVPRSKAPKLKCYNNPKLQSS